MIAGRRHHFSVLRGFSFWLIAFSKTLLWNVGILSSNLLLKSERIHKSSQEFYLCYQWYVFHVCHCWKGCNSLITICYLHDLFLCSICIILASDEIMVEVISLDVRRCLLITFLFLLNMIRNLLSSRYFCVVGSCNAQNLECLLWSMVFSADVETPFFNNFICTTKFKRVCHQSFTKQISRPKLEFLSC